MTPCSNGIATEKLSVLGGVGWPTENDFTSTFSILSATKEIKKKI